MSRLRKRAGTRLREPFGKAGLTVAIVALVMAMIGGAYAAGGLTKAQEKQVTKIAKKYAGKPGAAGTNGTNGKDGTNGSSGKDGSSGGPGQDGTDGKSVAVSTYTGEECEEAEGEEGAKFTNGTESAYACNGKPGAAGAEGSPWTLGGTLPQKATETGNLTILTNEANSQDLTGGAGEKNQYLTISLPIPLATALANDHVIYVPHGDLTAAHCSAGPNDTPSGPGGTFTNPKADPGYLCIYENDAINIEPSPTFLIFFGSAVASSFTSGVNLIMNVTGDANGSWTWAVSGS